MPSRARARSEPTIFKSIFAFILLPPSENVIASPPISEGAPTKSSLGCAYWLSSLMKEKSPFRLPRPSTSKSKLPESDNSFSEKEALNVPEATKPSTPATDPTPLTVPSTPLALT